MKHLTLKEIMKTKNFYLVVFLFFIIGTTLWCIYSPGTSIQTVVTHTKNKIIRQMETLKVDQAYLVQLGFTSTEKAPSGEKGNTAISSLPVVATSIHPDRSAQAKDFIHSVEKHLPDHFLILYDLGLGSGEALKLRKHCNVTRQCEVRTLNYKNYPSHVRYLDHYSYRPLCIQEVLNDYGSVIWADTSEFFISGNINETLKLAQSAGIAAWTIKDSTSSLTHPKMFSYFETGPENYYFHRAIESSHLVLYNRDKIHQKLMLPWVKCALKEDCISPFGAQSAGCNLRRPLFLYTGCHRYDMSALNVILGQVFQYVEDYASNDILFGYYNPSRLSGNKSAPLYLSRLYPLHRSKQLLTNVSIAFE